MASIPDPGVLAPDSPWTIRDFAAHLIVAAGLLTDIATALGNPWPIDPIAAALVLAAYAPGFGFVLHPETTKGHSAGYGIELRGVGEMTVRFTDGVYGLEEAGGPVDCTISADPVAFLMVGAGRLSRYEAIALGLMIPGGDRPELALSFPDLFLYP